MEIPTPQGWSGVQDTDPEGLRPPQGWSPACPPAPTLPTRPGESRLLSQASSGPSGGRPLCSSGARLGGTAVLGSGVVSGVSQTFLSRFQTLSSARAFARQASTSLASPCPACSPAALLLLSGVTCDPSHCYHPHARSSVSKGRFSGLPRFPSSFPLPRP